MFPGSGNSYAYLFCVMLQQNQYEILASLIPLTQKELQKELRVRLIIIIIQLMPVRLHSPKNNVVMYRPSAIEQVNRAHINDLFV